LSYGAALESVELTRNRKLFLGQEKKNTKETVAFAAANRFMEMHYKFRANSIHLHID
jgi:hypothetical protein